MLADVLTMTDHCGKPLAELSFCYLGQGRSNTANSLLVTGATLGMDARICARPAVSRRYEAETLVLETVFETSTGRASSARSWSGCCTSRPTRYSPSRDRPDEPSLGAPGNARPAGCACG